MHNQWWSLTYNYICSYAAITLGTLCDSLLLKEINVVYTTCTIFFVVCSDFQVGNWTFKMQQPFISVSVGV